MDGIAILSIVSAGNGTITSILVERQANATGPWTLVVNLTSTPYIATISTTSIENGSHRFRARAWDANVTAWSEAADHVQCHDRESSPCHLGIQHPRCICGHRIECG